MGKVRILSTLIMAALLGCAPTPVPVPNVEQKADYVESGSGGVFTHVPTVGKQSIQNGDSVRTGPAGRGWVDLGCALVSVFGGSNLQVIEVHINAANLGSTGSQLFSSACGEIQVTMGATPPEAVVRTSGTVFFAAHKDHTTLLWTQLGEAMLTNLLPDGSRGKTIAVPRGTFSTVVSGEPPSAPLPVADMGRIITEMGLGGEYSESVDLTAKRGFGNGAPNPTNIETIALVSPTPTFTPVAATPTSTPTSIPTSTPTRTLVPTITPTPTVFARLSAPHGLALYEATGNLWVTNAGTDSITEVDRKDPNRVLSVIPKVSSPNEIAIWQAKGLAYVTDPIENVVTEVNLVERRVQDIIKVGASPSSVAVDQSTGDVYVANNESNSLTLILRQGSTRREIPRSPRPIQILYSPSRNGFWVASQSGSVRFITHGDPGGEIQVAKEVFGLALTTDGFGGYVTLPNSNQIVAWGKAGQRTFTLKNPPYNIANLGNCLGVVVPEEKALVAIGFELAFMAEVHRIGEQGIGSAAGEIAYDAKADIAYVSNYLGDSITAIPRPCQTR